MTKAQEARKTIDEALERLSVQTGAARLGLASPADRESPGGLATAVLNRVAPDDLDKLRRDAIRREESRVRTPLNDTLQAVQDLRVLVKETLGFELNMAATTPQFDELVLEHDSVAEAWVTLLNGADGYKHCSWNSVQRSSKRASSHLEM